MASEGNVAIADVPGIVAGLRKTFNSHRTRDVSWRKKQLLRILDLVNEQEAALCAAVASDLGKSKPQAIIQETLVLKSEIGHAYNQLSEWTKKVPVKRDLHEALSRNQTFTQAEPLGVALIIGAWNYPIILCLQPLVGALAAGNTVLLKPSEQAPASAAFLARYLPQYVDPEVVRVCLGAVPETTAILKERFDHIFYTGGEMVGKIVMKAASAHLTPVVLELGGKSPCIVDSGSNLDLVAQRIIFGKQMNIGQTCIAPDYILVKEDVRAGLVKSLQKAMKKFFPQGTRKAEDWGRMINLRHFDRVTGLINSASGKVIGGDFDRQDKWIDLTLIDGASPDDPVMNEEIFGPVIPILPVRSVEEAVEFVAARPKPLTLYVFTKNQKTVDAFAAGTSSGGLVVNDCMFQMSTPLAFGGVGPSGMGAYHGKHSFDCFSHYKPVYQCSQDPLGEKLFEALRYNPLTKKKTDRLTMVAVKKPAVGPPLFKWAAQGVFLAGVVYLTSYVTRTFG